MAPSLKGKLLNLKCIAVTLTFAQLDVVDFHRRLHPLSLLPPLPEMEKKLISVKNVYS